LSNAAKNDFLGADSDGNFTFKIEDLLANDAGGAKASSFFFGHGDQDQAAYMLAHGITLNDDGSYTVTGGDFEYSVQIGNKGTFSTAQVDVAAHLSEKELLQNWDFEQGDANADHTGFVSLTSIPGWTNEAGGSSPMEVQHESFGFLKGFADGEKQWFDTSASPGNVHIGQTADILADGAKAQLTVSVAAESIIFTNSNGTNTYQPDADDHLLFNFNGETVLDLKLANFTDGGGNVDWNQFHDFTVNVTGQAGADHFEIQSTGMDQYTDGNGVIHGYAGFAVDHVSLQEWIIG
jgi:hypothetical protein